MRPSSSQPARFFATAKTHKFHNTNEINLEELKLRPIIDQTGTAIYQTSKVISKYLQPRSKNDYVIDDCLLFPDILRNVTLEDDEELVSYDVEALFTSIPVMDTINYICHQIYVKKA